MKTLLIIDAGLGQARAWMADQGAAHADPRLLASADMRYQGQSFEIDTALPLDAIVRGEEVPVPREIDMQLFEQAVNMTATALRGAMVV